MLPARTLSSIWNHEKDHFRPPFSFIFFDSLFHFYVCNEYFPRSLNHFLCMMINVSRVDLRIYTYARYYSACCITRIFLSSSIIRRIPMSEHRYHVGRSNSDFEAIDVAFV